jgi:transposase
MNERVALVGVDWGDKNNAFEVRGADGKRRQGKFENRPEAVHAWVAELRREYPSGTIAVAIEQCRGALIYALSRYEFIELLAVQPARTAAYRKVARPSGAKNDPLDASLICDYVDKHGETLQALTAADPLTRELMLLVEWRRKFVEQRVSLCQQLRDTLKQYFPQALDWIGELGTPMSLAFLEQWPTLEKLQGSRAVTIRSFYTGHGSRSAAVIEQRVREIDSAQALHSDAALIAALSTIVGSLVPLIRASSKQIAHFDERIVQLWSKHPDRALFESFPGAGAVLGPRLAVALGTDRSRWTTSALQTFSGIAPVTEQSGSKRWVHSRWLCPKFVRQTFHEFAEWSIPHCPWANRFYRLQRQRGKGHHAAIRALAFRWIRIIVRCWKDRKPYDDERYAKRLLETRSPSAAPHLLA